MSRTFFVQNSSLIVQGMVPFLVIRVVRKQKLNI